MSVTSEVGFKVGDEIVITGGGNAEIRTIVDFGTIVLNQPLALSYPSGAAVTLLLSQLAPATETSTVGGSDALTAPVLLIGACVVGSVGFALWALTAVAKGPNGECSEKDGEFADALATQEEGKSPRKSISISPVAKWLAKMDAGAGDVQKASALAPLAKGVTLGEFPGNLQKHQLQAEASTVEEAAPLAHQSKQEAVMLEKAATMALNAGSLKESACVERNATRAVASKSATSKPKRPRKNALDPELETKHSGSNPAEEEGKLEKIRKKRRPGTKSLGNISSFRHGEEKSKDEGGEATDLSVEDHLKILGLPLDAGIADVRRQYYFAIKHSATSNTGITKTAAEAKFRKVQESYRVLMAHFQEVQPAVASYRR